MAKDLKYRAVCGFTHKLRDNIYMSRVYDRDPYAILGIFPTATDSQVKEAYYRLARRYHPDLNKDPRAGEQMKDINWAYDILRDPQERSLYDYWRNYGVQAEYYYPGTSPPYSRDDQGPKPPPYSPYGTRSYTNVRVTRSSSSLGCSAWGIVWIIVILITNLARAIGPSLSQRPNYDFSPEFRATQTAQMERIEATLDAFSASRKISTVLAAEPPASPLPFLVTPYPATKVRQEAEPVQEGWRSRIVPGSWEYHYISLYFPELTTPNGLSAEVTDVIYDQLRGYHIKTRSSGDYWLHINPYDKSVAPEHISPKATVTPTR